MTKMRHLALRATDALYQHALRPLLFRLSAEAAHERVLAWLAVADASPLALRLARALNRTFFPHAPVTVGGVSLPHPFVVAAGLVKGRGFKGEAHALNAVQRGLNVMAGWQSVPALVGTVEFGSFTRHPRTGNSGTVVWRDPHTRSTQNRIGLKNPGAHAAAEFLAQRRYALPAIFGVNIAPTPALPTPEAEANDVRECLQAFLSRHVLPSWFTLNLSCPNTEDDPHGNQTEEKTRLLCRTLLDTLRAYGQSTPLWVKISPALAPEQVAALVRVFTQEGVSAVIATNTLGAPAPNAPHQQAGIGGGTLHPYALETVRHLRHTIDAQKSTLDVIACGGVLDGASYAQYRALGVRAVQYWSALIYRGWLAAPLIHLEAQ